MKLCPNCHAPVHRSSTRGLAEKLAKVLTSYRPHRCRQCGWRGLLAKEGYAVHRGVRWTVLKELAFLILITTVALYITRYVFSPPNASKNYKPPAAVTPETAVTPPAK